MWPDIFTTENIEGKSSAELCACGLIAWGNCQMRAPMPKSFGHVMVKIGQRLGIPALPENLRDYAYKIITESAVTK